MLEALGGDLVDATDLSIERFASDAKWSLLKCN
jgi:hypothetical protein